MARGSATLRLALQPKEDIGLLAGLVATEASAGWLGITVAGARDA